MKFICPICSRILAISENGAAVCPSGHSFDRSREGYYNLLVNASAKTHGDNREMLTARRRFLDTGAYLPLAERVADAVCKSMPRGGALLDVGCGEGYYTDLVKRAMGDRGEAWGFDISRDAVRLAARRSRELHLAVASAYRMPVADESIDVAMNIFSPLAIEEIRRILRRGGRFIMAIPDENHLFGLKQALYSTPYKNVVKDKHIDGFTLISEERISYPLCLDSGEKVYSLFMMTPYAYRTPREAVERVLSLDSLECEADFTLLVYGKD